MKNPTFFHTGEKNMDPTAASTASNSKSQQKCIKNILYE